MTEIIDYIFFNSNKLLEHYSRYKKIFSSCDANLFQIQCHNMHYLVSKSNSYQMWICKIWTRTKGNILWEKL
ncbi:hypothetical protein WN944_023613 [Citrus x changshan-huyou]|uniref:Uncharacterized protein n=1 Tax=Citrus x changshan-huyou TaxID=2935761 RepID=A0AAP0R3W2_9ROSI